MIGGGLLGLEAANGLRRQGMDVTVVHLADTLMERQLDAAAAGLLQRSWRSAACNSSCPPPPPPFSANPG